LKKVITAWRVPSFSHDQFVTAYTIFRHAGGVRNGFSYSLCFNNGLIRRFWIEKAKANFIYYADSSTFRLFCNKNRDGTFTILGDRTIYFWLEITF
jgi:hypothetical protein